MNLDNLFLFNFTTISRFFTPVELDIVPRNLAQIFNDFVNAIGNLSKKVTVNAFCPIHFTELQTILLTIFLVILSINLALIGFYWQKYGGVITDRFIRPSTFQSISFATYKLCFSIWVNLIDLFVIFLLRIHL